MIINHKEIRMVKDGEDKHGLQNDGYLEKFWLNFKRFVNRALAPFGFAIVFSWCTSKCFSSGRPCYILLKIHWNWSKY